MSPDTLASVSSPSVVNAVVGGSFAGPVPGPGRRWPASSLPRPSQPASAGTWLACFESTGISDSYGVVRGK